MGVTISTHNGSSVARDHNIRNRKVTDKESHIDPNGVYEIWHDEKLTDAYHRLFDSAVERYNAKQSRADRRIENYLAAVQKDAVKKPVYEMIIGVYGSDCTTDAKKEILRQFVDGWKERNPNLELIGAYYHADEEGQDPHVHIDYIPVAHGYKRGMDTQNGLVKALEEQGIESGKTMKETAQIKWERRENELLERLCVDRGLTVEHPSSGKKHLDTPEYKQLQDEIQKAQMEKEAVEQKVELGKAICDDIRKDMVQLTSQAKAEREAVNGIIDRKRSAQQEYLQVYSNLNKAKTKLEEVREESNELYGFLEGTKDEIAVCTAELDEKKDELNEINSEIQNAREEHREAVQKAEAVKGDAEALSTEHDALEVSVMILRDERQKAEQELGIVRDAISREYDRGNELYGGTMAQRMEAARKEAEKNNLIASLQKKVKMYEAFISAFPDVLEKFRSWIEQQKMKEKKKKQQRGHDDR